MLLVVLTVRAATLDVCATCAHTSISSAVTAASGGDVVLVQPGTYVGSLVIDQELTLRSTGGALATRILPSGGNHTLDVSGDLTLEGFEVVPAAHRAVHVTGGSTIIRDLLVRNATGRHGVGVDVNGAVASVSQSSFTHLTSTEGGACLHVHGGGDLTVSNSSCTDPSAAFGGGVALDTASNVQLEGLTITRATSAGNGGAIWARDVSNLALDGLVVDGGTAAGEGGLVWVDQVSNLTVRDSVLRGGIGTRGAGLFVTAVSSATITGCVFEDNVASARGGALHTDGVVTVGRTRFHDNAALAGAGLQLNVHAEGTLSDVVFIGNVATSGAGGAVAVGAGASLQARGVYACRNEAVRGGVLSVDGDAELSHAVLYDNRAASAGSVATVAGSLTLDQSTVLDNTSPSGAIEGVGSLDASHTGFIDSDGYALVQITPDIDWSAWWGNTPADVAAPLTPADRGTHPVTTDPVLSGPSSGSCRTATFVPPPGSALIDAGDPALTDADGSVRDIGAYGGEALTDGDGDGVPFVLDCDDDASTVGPGFPELCGDGMDNDCDGIVDCTGTTWFADDDGDGAGDPSDTVVQVAMPTGYVATGGDCDDTDADVNPGATEVCNGLDDNCVGGVDEGLDQTWFTDADGDDFGTLPVVVDCARPSGTSMNDGDCDDTDPTANPAGTEVCGGGDEDCDGLVDAADPDLSASGWFADADGDGFGEATSPVGACEHGVPDATDCDDADPGVFPGAMEIWYDGIDQDCDGNDDDQDGDGWGAQSDCDDRDAARNPGRTDVPDDGVDQDCDGVDAMYVYSNGGTGCTCATSRGHGGALAWALFARR